MNEAPAQELLALNQRLLDAIADADWATYRELCDPTLTCFEPEAQGNLVRGLEFHEFYFKLGPLRGEHLATMSSPHVRFMGDVAIVCYVRLNQRVAADGKPTTQATEETRVWQQQEGRWKHVHFHRSAPVGR